MMIMMMKMMKNQDDDDDGFPCVSANLGAAFIFMIISILTIMFIGLWK